MTFLPHQRPSPHIADGWSQPFGWSQRAMYADDSKPHQIRVTWTENAIHVTCTCRRYDRALHGQDDIANARLIYVAEHESQL